MVRWTPSYLSADALAGSSGSIWSGFDWSKGDECRISLRVEDEEAP